MMKKSQKRMSRRANRGQLIRDFRSGLGLSQKLFGALLGVGQSTVANYEIGGRALGKPAELALLRLADEHKFPLTVFNLRE